MNAQDWVVCIQGRGRVRERDGSVSRRERHFQENTVAQVVSLDGQTLTVWNIRDDTEWDIPLHEAQQIDMAKMSIRGDGKHKICNLCFRLLPLSSFAKNQNNQHGDVRRPSCLDCRTGIDKRAPKSQQAKRFEKTRPQHGTPFKCPICGKRSIVGVTAKVVADHNHHTGDIRDWLCDSCNTGLGRFKNGKDCLKDALAYLQERDRGPA